MIHCFTVNDQKMVLDVASGALHMVEDTAYEVLRAMQENCETEGYKPEDFDNILGNIKENLRIESGDFEEISGEIRSLMESGQLFSEEPDGTAAFMQVREPVVKALCLHIAHECNLQCVYCFAGQGVYGGDRGLMSPETGRKAIDFLIARSGKRRNLEVDFFGGEPTLNFETVKQIVTYGRSREAETGKRFRFTLTTNGLLLDDEKNAYINEHMDNVVLSIDGRPAVNDRMRKKTNGTGCYNDILPKLKKLAESRNHERYYVRGTYTRYNKDFAEDVLHLADMGFTQISVEPAVADPAEDYAIRPEDVPELNAEYEKLAAALLKRKREGNPVRFFHFEIDLDGGPCVAKRVTGCGAGTEYLAVTPGGALYPCHQFVGNESFCIGHLDTGITQPQLCERFKNRHVYAKPDCTNCWARFYCSGGCAANAYHANGDLSSPDTIGCALMRKRIECALFYASQPK